MFWIYRKVGLILIAILTFVLLSFWHSPVAAISIEDFWSGEAHFQQVGEIDWAKAPQGSLRESSSWFAVRPGVWYAFNRMTIPDPDGKCPSTHMRVVVRESYNKGVSWSEPTTAIEPGDSLQGDGCAVLDGSSFFDASSGTWHMLVQCSDKGNQGGWSLCHYTRRYSPMGRFSPDINNPVVRGGALWSKICTGSVNSCPKTTVDEGTPDIISKTSGKFIVTFHGFDYASKRGFRGVTSTDDFKKWALAGAGLPGTPILGSTDCAKWLRGCIGVGQASILLSRNYIYMLVEVMDKSLECLPNQQWVFHLIRTRKGILPASGAGKWQKFSGKPFLTPMIDDPETACKVTYARWIKDGSDLYLVYEDRIPKSIYLRRRLLKLLAGGGQPVRVEDNP